MLAYVFWHRPARAVAAGDYEQTLIRFHRSLAHQPPSGLLGSCTLRAESLAWLPDELSGFSAGGYEDWYVVEDWEALGVLEEAAVSHGHHDAHAAAARRSGAGTAAVYRRVEGRLAPAQAHAAVWVTRPHAGAELEPAELLADGLEPERVSLWRRCLVLGPAPELCVLGAWSEPPAGSGLAATRLPVGWTAAVGTREALADG
jgi:hypothetical protein